MVLRAVVLPDPLVPRRTRISPSGTESEIRSRASAPPGKRLVTSARVAAAVNSPMSSVRSFLMRPSTVAWRRRVSPLLKVPRMRREPSYPELSTSTRMTCSPGRDVEHLVRRSLAHAEAQDLLRDLSRKSFLQHLLVVHEDAQGAAAQRMIEVDLEVPGRLRARAGRGAGSARARSRSPGAPPAGTRARRPAARSGRRRRAIPRARPGAA